MSYRIGSFTLDGDNVVLLRGGAPLPLGRRAVLLLLHLVRHKGEIVPKQVLYDAAWPGQTVEESNLTVQISHLRRVLEAEGPGGRAWLETLPRRGYRFVGPAEQEVDPRKHPASKPGPVANIPVALPLHFTGREAAMAAMGAALGRRRSAPPAGPQIVALHGMRGLGKTMLAAAFAAGEAARYRATWWVRAEAAATARADLAALAPRLGWAGREAPEALAFQATLDGLQREGDGVLLIYDNALDAASLRPFLPRTGAAHIVVTSNSNVWRAVATTVEPDLWPKDTGAEFLLARTDRSSERSAAAALSEALGGLPLAHEQAAAYVESLDIPLAEYLRRLDAAPIRLLDDPLHAPADYHGGLTVAKALHLAVEQAEARDPAAPELLRHLALLPAEPVPLALFRDGAAAFGPALAAAAAGERLEETLAVLRRLGLVRREAVPDERNPAVATESVVLHRLVRQIVGSQVPAEAASRMRAALTGAMAVAYPADVFDNVATWPLARRLDSLAEALVVPSSAMAPGAEPAAIALLVRLASYRHGPLGAYEEASTLFEAALQLSEATHGPGHEMTATLLNNLALVLRDCGEPSQARPLHRRALAVREAVFGPGHPEVAVSLGNLANVTSECGDPAGAIPLLERALAIRQAHFGEESSQAAQFMNNLGRQLHLAGQPGRARPLLERALALRERLLGPDNPNTANSMGNLALLMLDAGEPGSAAELAERALRVTEAALGPQHPLITSVCAIYAQCLLAQAGPAVALPHAERALTLGASVLAPGAQHLRRAASVTADCLDALGRQEDAVAVRRRHRGPG